jgi:putative hemolysin
MPIADDVSAAKRRRFQAEIATSEEDIRAAMALRYRVFAQEMGANLHSRAEGLDYDQFDDYCDHLLVRDTQTNTIVASTRLLTDVKAAQIGHFYSESEFRLEQVLALPGRFLEIGRTCVDPAQRGGVVLATLWNGLADYVNRGEFNYLMGCASISAGPHGFPVESVFRHIATHQFGPTEYKVDSRRPIPMWRRCIQDENGIPPLLQAYLRLGCWVFSDPYWDEDFNCMDVFILLDLTRLQERYEKRFLPNSINVASRELQSLV